MSVTYRTSDGGTVEQYKGAVLDRGEHNHYHDSYFYVLVWDGTAVKEVETHSTAYGGPWPTVEIDATPGVVEAARQYRCEQWVYTAVMHAYRDREQPKVGVTVRSTTTTRGKNKGVTGVVGLVTANTYSSDPSATRVRVQTEDGEQRWLDGNRVEVVDAPPVDLNTILRAAKALFRW